MGSRSSAVDVALLLLRVFVGVAFVLHGWGKVRDVGGFSAANGVPVFLGAAAAYVQFVRSARHSRARYVGSQPGVTLEWQVDRHLTLTLEYGHFFAGPFLEETEPGRDIDWSAATLTYKF